MIEIIKKYNIFYIVLLTIAFFSSCKTVDKCAENPEIGNLGSILNSNLDEHSPSILVLPEEVKTAFPNVDTKDYLYYTTTRYDQGSNEAVYRAKLMELNDGIELVDDPNFPINDTLNFRNAGLPSFFYNETSGKLELYFAALPKKGRLSRDIFFSEFNFEENAWSEAKSLSDINSSHYESHPAISPDGKFLVFSSDRPGGLGDIDLWYSVRNDTAWSIPVNLGEGINTKSTDYTPSFLPNMDLLFASNGFEKDRTDFDIFVAKFVQDTEESVEPAEVDTLVENESLSKSLWENPTPFNYPINSEFDETGPAVHNNTVYLSSNRRGGCGGKDIYAFHLCGPVFLNGTIFSLEDNILLEGDIFLKNEAGEVLAHSEVSANGTFDLGAILPNNNYIVDYKNRCFPLRRNIYDFSAPCSDSSVVVVTLQMGLPEKNAELELTEVEIPYFVTGYYKPNTEMNLDALRLKFTYNLFGNSQKTKYIENPGENYNNFTSQVEAGLNDVVNYIANMIGSIRNLCLPEEERGVLKIHVQGWADPRPISANSEYADADINDTVFNLNVKKGASMDNLLLSKLRAYYTAKYFQEELAKVYSLEEIEKGVLWSIEGMGIDTTENVDLELKRKVKIFLEYIEK